MMVKVIFLGSEGLLCNEMILCNILAPKHDPDTPHMSAT